MSQNNFYFILEALSQILAIKDSLSSKILLILDATDFLFIRHSETKKTFYFSSAVVKGTVSDMKLIFWIELIVLV